MGNDAAGHYVKMVHNGIEYAMMQMIAEVYDLLRRGAGYTNPALHAVFKKWNKGSLQSFLMEVTADIFKIGDTETPGNEDFLIDQILDQAGSKGTGKWTSQEAMNLPVPVPTIDMAVAMRDISVYKQERKQMAGLYQSAVQPLNIPGESLEGELEGALHFSFIIAYAQGLAMLAKASEVLKMDIPMPKVIQVWKAGCIIRSALLPVFEKAYAANKTLPNVLLDKGVAALLQKNEQRLRRVVAAAVEAKIPLAGIGSVLSYFDAYCSERLPTNLIQAQRDFFGAHTYQRIDKPGVFHTEWND
jgi:6-phosphogluconate dehydrogenase